MLHKAWHSIEEMPCCFSRSPIKFQSYDGPKIDNLNPICVRLLGRSQLSSPSDLPCFLLTEWAQFCKDSRLLHLIPASVSAASYLVIITCFWLRQLETYDVRNPGGALPMLRSLWCAAQMGHFWGPQSPYIWVHFWRNVLRIGSYILSLSLQLGSK